MKWETLKQRVANEVRGSIHGNPHLAGLNRVHIGDQMLVCIGAILSGEIHKMRQDSGSSNLQYSTAKALADAAYLRVMAWDVRCVGTLRELFPQHFPKTLLKGPLVAFIEDESDEWVVEKVCH